MFQDGLQKGKNESPPALTPKKAGKKVSRESGSIGPLGGLLVATVAKERQVKGLEHGE